MPLLKKEPLERSPLPENLKPNDEVYYCKTTNEVFTDYEKLFERVILCNSLVWTCSITGKSGLTYQDALASEKHAKELLSTFPEALKKPILFLSTLTHRSNLNDLVDDIFAHIKDKYFVGETVEAFVDSGNVKKSYKVLKVMLTDDKTKAAINGNVPSKEVKSPSKKVSSPAKSNSPEACPDSDGFEYALQEICGQITSVRVLKGSKLMRKKGVFTREKCKLFLKSNCEADSTQHIWKVKESATKKFRIAGVSYESIAPGPLPVFGVSDSRKSEKESSGVIDLTCEDQGTTKAKKASSSDSNDKGHSDSQRVQEARLRAQKDMQRVEEDLRNMKAMAAEKKQKKLEEKMEMKRKAEMEKAKKMEEKKKEKEIKKLRAVERNTPREDLECEDLKDLPATFPVNCTHLKMEYFGDLMFVKEFIIAFKSLLDLDVPKNFSLERFLKCLTSTCVNGDYGKLLLSVMSSLLSNSKEVEKQTGEDGKVEDGAEMAYAKATKLAASAYGLTLADLQLDVYSLSEVVRMYLKSLPQTNFVSDCSWNITDPESFIDNLDEKSVFEMSAENKLQVLYILCHQLLSCNLMKARIEDNLERLKVAQRNLKSHQINCLRREKDEAQYWAKKKQEQRLKSLLTGEVKTNSEDNPKNEDPSVRKSSRVAQTIPDENFEKLPVENIDWDKITDNEKQQMKMWEKRKEESLANEVSELLSGCPVILGFDRTHRQYWKFTSMPGIFVEDYEDEISGFKFSSPIKMRIMSPSRRKKDDEQKVTLDGKSNKENIPADARPHAKCKTTSVQDQVASKGSTRWSFYNQVEQVDLLMQNLNVWGIRECHLLTNLKEHYASIVEELKDVDAINKTFTPLQHENEDAASNTDESSESENGLEKSLVESILDLEERIFVGVLGKLKNIDRTKWRDALEKGDYDFIIKLEGGNKKEDVVLEGLASALIHVERMVESRFIDIHLGQKDKKSKQKQKKKETEDSDDDASSTSSHAARSGALDKWESRVKYSTNLSQLFLSMSIIDNCISWSKSALKARCFKCKRKGDGENMLLCDGCDKGYHTYCLEPAVKNIPEGDWFCPMCQSQRPKPKVAPKKAEARPPEYDSETKDYDDFDQSSMEEEANDDSEDEEYHVKQTKQELLEKSFYAKTTTRTSNGKKNHPVHKKSSQNTRISKRKHIEDDDEEEEHAPEVRREKRKKLSNGALNTTDVLDDIPMKSCEALVTELMANEDAWPFLRPVSKKDVPDYYDVIERPMDFSKIRNKIHSFSYDRPRELIDDIHLIFDNCRTYNKPSTGFYKAAEDLSQLLKKRLEELKPFSTQCTSKDARKDSIGSEGGALRKKRTRIVDSDSECEEPPRNLRKRTF